jgi:cytochrome oxidase Cu insertion factor (SCO1/SenC/PrrC family)
MALRGVAGALGAFVPALVLAAAVAAHEPAPPPPPLEYEPPAPGSYELPVIQRVSEHWLLDASGEKAPLPGVGEDEVAVVSFVYGRCAEACPLALATLRSLDRELAAAPALSRRTRLVTVSFDPEQDDPARMAELREHMAPRGRWDFLTAPDRGTLAPVLADYGQNVTAIPVEGTDAERLQHVLKVFLVDGSGAVRNIYSTGFLVPRVLRNDVATVLGVVEGGGE